MDSLQGAGLGMEKAAGAQSQSATPEAAGLQAPSYAPGTAAAGPKAGGREPSATPSTGYMATGLPLYTMLELANPLGHQHRSLDLTVPTLPAEVKAKLAAMGLPDLSHIYGPTIDSGSTRTSSTTTLLGQTSAPCPFSVAERSRGTPAAADMRLHPIRPASSLADPTLRPVCPSASAPLLQDHSTMRSEQPTAAHLDPANTSNTLLSGGSVSAQLAGSRPGDDRVSTCHQPLSLLQKALHQLGTRHHPAHHAPSRVQNDVPLPSCPDRPSRSAGQSREEVQRPTLHHGRRDRNTSMTVQRGGPARPRPPPQHLKNGRHQGQGQNLRQQQQCASSGDRGASRKGAASKEGTLKGPWSVLDLPPGYEFMAADFGK